MSQPNGLPKDKADKLAEKIGEQVYKVYKDSKDDLVKHDVRPDQAKEIVYDGFSKGLEKIGRNEGDSAFGRFTI